MRRELLGGLGRLEEARYAGFEIELALKVRVGRVLEGNAALKRELLAHGLTLPDGVKVDEKAGGTSASKTNSWSAGVSRVVSYFSDVWRRMVLLVANLQRDIYRKG